MGGCHVHGDRCDPEPGLFAVPLALRAARSPGTEAVRVVSFLPRARCNLLFGKGSAADLAAGGGSAKLR